MPTKSVGLQMVVADGPRPLAIADGLRTFWSMRAGRWQRVGTGILGLWMVIAIQAMAVLPMLDGDMRGMGDMPGMTSAPASAPQHCLHAADAANAPSGTPDRSPVHHHADGCACCCCSGATLPLTAPRLVAFAPISAAGPSTAAKPLDDARRHTAPQVALPPPLGPPAHIA